MANQMMTLVLEQKHEVITVNNAAEHRESIIAPPERLRP
jgi:hypothetical protein